VVTPLRLRSSWKTSASVIETVARASVSMTPRSLSRTSMAKDFEYR
jgi:hypothetical protein